MNFGPVAGIDVSKSFSDMCILSRRGCGQKVGQVMLSSQDAAYIPKGCGLLRTT